MAREHWTPLSILVGSAVIAAGLYLGLRERAAPVVAMPASTPGASVSAVSPVTSAPVAVKPLALAESASDVGAATASVSAPTDAATLAETKSAVARLRVDIVKACFDPHRHDPGAPKRVKLSYTGVFDAGGHEVGRGLGDVRDAFFAPVSDCVRTLPMNLRIAAPGKFVNVSEIIELE